MPELEDPIAANPRGAFSAGPDWVDPWDTSPPTVAQMAARGEITRMDPNILRAKLTTNNINAEDI